MGKHFYWDEDGEEERRRMGGDGRPLVSWPGRIRAVWDRSDLTQPSFSRTGHVRLDLSHTTDIIPLSGETTAHHHSTADGEEREGGGHKVSEKKGKATKDVSQITVHQQVERGQSLGWEE